jgi:hypothetical protein
MYSPKYEKQLQSDPIIIEIDGEVFKFRHMNPFRGDIPETRRSVFQAVSQFQTAEDFANLKPLLEGVAYAKRHFDTSFYTKIIRLAGAKGHIYQIIECARGVRHTGYRLDRSETVNELLHWVQMKAVDSAWDPAQTAQALRWSEMVLDLLADEAHQPRYNKENPPAPGELPLDRDPQVLLAPLHLASVLASQPEAPADLVDKVNSYAHDIVRLWPEGTPLRAVQPKVLYEDTDKLGYLNEPNKFVTLAAPLLYGLEQAAKVAEPQLADQLRSRASTLSAEIQSAREAFSKPGRGEAVYQKLYNS